MNNICVNGYFSQTGESCSEWAGATLEKLPLWGLKEPGDSENSFEWPTQADWATMSPDVQLLSLELGTVGYMTDLCAVKVNLTNG